MNGSSRGRAFGQDQQAAGKDEEKNDGREPPFLANTQFGIGWRRESGMKCAAYKRIEALF